MPRLSMKVWVVAVCLLASFDAHAFNSLSCKGDLDVRLKGPNAKGDKVVKTFTIKRIEALELTLSFGGIAVGRLFPWDHVVWEADPAFTKSFKDLKFKTDDEKIITLAFASLDGSKHSLSCFFDF